MKSEKDWLKEWCDNPNCPCTIKKIQADVLRQVAMELSFYREIKPEYKKQRLVYRWRFLAEELDPR